MNFLKRAARFSKDEDGAVTVDWVVLTAAVVGMSVVGFATVRDAATTLGTETASTMTGS